MSDRPFSQDRVFGLDVVRALAIVLVLLAHSDWFFQITSPPIRGMLSLFGNLGVELFFVLSGFLIGQIAIRVFEGGVTLSGVLNFWWRRWLRTLPNYFLVLVSLILIVRMRTGQLQLHPLHFVFLQNFDPTEMNFFPVAWSLSVEEWFYLSLPLLFLITNKSRRSLFVTLTVVIVAIAFARLLFVLVTDQPQYMVRRMIPLRFDSLLIGVALAYLKGFRPALYMQMGRPFAFVVALILLLATGGYFVYSYALDRYDHSLFFCTFAFSVVSLIFALFIAFFDRVRVQAEDC